MKPKFMLNPDAEFVKGLKQRIKKNSGFCPCRLEKNPDTKCPCKDFRELGECCCGLYVRDYSGEEFNVD